LHCFRFN